MSTVYERLTDLLTTRFGVEAAQIEPTAKFIDLDLDSLALVEIVLTAQEEFGVEIDDSELTPTHTLADAVEVLAAKGAAV